MHVGYVTQTQQKLCNKPILLCLSIYVCTNFFIKYNLKLKWHYVNSQMSHLTSMKAQATTFNRTMLCVGASWLLLGSAQSCMSHHPLAYYFITIIFSNVLYSDCMQMVVNKNTQKSCETDIANWANTMTFCTLSGDMPCIINSALIMLD